MLSEEMKSEMKLDTFSSERIRCFSGMRKNTVVSMSEYLSFCDECASLFGFRKTPLKMNTEKNRL